MSGRTKSALLAADTTSRARRRTLFGPVQRLEHPDGQINLHSLVGFDSFRVAAISKRVSKTCGKHVELQAVHSHHFLRISPVDELRSDLQRRHHRRLVLQVVVNRSKDVKRLDQDLSSVKESESRVPAALLVLPYVHSRCVAGFAGSSSNRLGKSTTGIGAVRGCRRSRSQSRAGRVDRESIESSASASVIDVCARRERRRERTSSSVTMPESSSFAIPTTTVAAAIGSS